MPKNRIDSDPPTSAESAVGGRLQAEGPRFNSYIIIIFLLTLVVPVLVLPMVVDNAFNTPKTLFMLIGVSTMIGVYAFQFLRGRPVLRSETSTPKILLFLIFLNFFSFFYTGNYYFTIIAAIMNITCLLFFYFVSLYVDGKKAFWLIMTAALSGMLVSIVTYFQYTNHFIIFKWATPGIMVMGTIGNSNYLGAYMVFPLFAMAGLIFLLKGKFRFIPLVLLIFMLGAFLFTRARAGWMGFFLALPIFLYLLKKIHKISLFGYLSSHPRQVATYGIVFLGILVSLWQVNDLAAARFMEGFYRDLSLGRPMAEAVRQSKLDLIRHGLTISEEDLAKLKATRGGSAETAPVDAESESPGTYRLSAYHPFYWAPFVLVGQ